MRGFFRFIGFASRLFRDVPFVIPRNEESGCKYVITNILHPDSSFLGMTKATL